MLLRGSSSRARGQQPNRSRATSRGRGSTSRGASSSSSKSKHRNSALLASTALVLNGTSNTNHEGTRGRLHKKQYSNIKPTGTTPTTNPPNPFDQERLENAVKREQRGQDGSTVNGRGSRGNVRGFSNKQVRFAEAASESRATTSKSPSPAPSNPFAVASTIPAPWSPAPASFNPFAPKSTGPSMMSSANANPFVSPSQHPATTSVFGAPSGPFSNGRVTTSSVTPSLSIFGGSSTPSIWGQPDSTAPQKIGIVEAPSSLQSSLSTPTSSTFGAPATITPSARPSTSVSTPATTFAPSANPFSKTKINGTTTAVSNGFSPQKPPSTLLTPPPPLDNNTTTVGGTTLGGKIELLLRKEGITAPKWPTSTPGDPQQKATVEAFWQTSKGYRNKVRTALIRAGYLDDPDKPKKLSEAIDFKGTCEDMCPEFEKITRIVEHDVQNAEKEPAPDGSLWPAPTKMVKALARSAAGQDAPLPMDVRSPAALRRTLDYLFDRVLDAGDNLASVHGFLWDRTRAIRRDFVFQSSMTPSELEDQVYCLERITSFHVIALHLMSRQDVTAEDFSEQQEIEQLGKALLSLMHAYEDCQVQGLECANECQFRAYYVLFNAHHPGILETVQDWGWKFWGASDEIQSAVRLVEALQNIWDARGPLKPHSATDVAQNAFSRFFSTIEDKDISYTMACFAEIHFNSVRKAALQTIVTSYRKQRDQTRDWNLTSLNAYLRFDDEQDIIPFCETYGLHFDDVDGEEYLSLETDDQIADPFPPNKQRYSYDLVERKRGNHPLQHAINFNVWDEEMAPTIQEDDRLFVSQNPVVSEPQPLGTTPPPFPAPQNDTASNDLLQPAPTTEARPALNEETRPTSKSLFDRMSPAPPALGSNSSSTMGTQGPKPAKQEPTLFASQQTSAAGRSILKLPSTKTESSAPLFFFNKEVSTLTATESPNISKDLGSAPNLATPLEVPPIAPLFKPLFEPLRPPSAGSNPKPLPQPEFQFAAQEPSPEAPLASSSLHLGGPAITPYAPIQVPSPASRQVSTCNSEVSLEKIVPQTKPPLPMQAKDRLAGVSHWVALGDDGLVDQFMAFTVENILASTYRDFMEEKARRAVKAADELARREADHFRYRSLATKYGYLWREAAHRKWLRRRGKEARQARRGMAEDLKTSKMAFSTNIVEDFKASITATRRSSLESLLGVTGALNGAHDPVQAIWSIAKAEPRMHEHKRHKSDRSTRSTAMSSSSQKGGRPSDPLRRSLLSDPSYLDGKSRMHLLPKNGSEDEGRRRSSGVQTDYFRLKARGITTLPNGAPLASSVAKDVMSPKRSSEAKSETYSRKPPQLEYNSNDIESKSSMQSKTLVNGFSFTEDKLKSKPATKSLTVNGKEHVQKHKRGFEEDDEEELFERAKRIREQMDEGLEWYRKEIERDTTTRSFS